MTAELCMQGLRDIYKQMEQEALRLRAELNKLGYQNGDLCDEVYALREQVRIKDQMIQELQTLVVSR